jgi:hypothetical protein
MTLKWGSFKDPSYDMRRLIIKHFWSLFLIYYRHFYFLSWGSKSVQVFPFVLTLIWGCSKWVQIALFASWNNSDFQCLFLIGCLISRIFYNLALFASWQLLELLYICFEHKLRIIVSSTPVQDLNWAAPATFRTQREQIRTHFEQPQIRLRTKWKILTLLEPKHKNFKCLLKIEGSL